VSSVKVDRVTSPKYRLLDEAVRWLEKPPPHPTRKTARYSFIIHSPKNNRRSTKRLRSPIRPFSINFFVKPLQAIATPSNPEITS